VWCVVLVRWCVGVWCVVCWCVGVGWRIYINEKIDVKEIGEDFPELKEIYDEFKFIQHERGDRGRVKPRGGEYGGVWCVVVCGVLMVCVCLQ